jgi:ribonuclease-3
MLADVFEALVAAIFLDGGWESARDFVLQFVEPEVERVTRDSVAYDSKSQLLHVVQRLWGGSPRYCLLDEQGPDHNKCFKVAADVNGHRFPPAWGRTKKEAESKAAHNALAELEEKEIPFP